MHHCGLLSSQISDSARVHAVDSESNPKRKRGQKLRPSLTLRVTMSCVIINRMQYSIPQVTTFCMETVTFI